MCLFGEGVSRRVLTHLGLVADEDVVLHGVGDVVDGELQERPLGHVDEPHARPGGAAVLGVWPLDHRHSLERWREGRERGS